MKSSENFASRAILIDLGGDLGQIDGRPDRRTYTFHTAVVDPSGPAPDVAVPRHNYELRLLCAWPKAGDDAKL